MTDTETLWHQHQTRLKQFILARIQPPLEADDILQDVYVKMHTHLDKLKDGDKLTAWLYQITRNVIIDHHRARKKISPAGDWPADEPSTSTALFTELQHCLAPLMQQLPASDQAMLQLSDLEGLPQQHIAERWQLPLSTAKSRIQRARGKLKQLFMDCCAYQFNQKGQLLDYEAQSKNCRC